MIKHANLQLLTAYPGGVLEKTDDINKRVHLSQYQWVGQPSVPGVS